jgi:hypothetical protein
MATEDEGTDEPHEYVLKGVKNAPVSVSAA